MGENSEVASSFTDSRMGLHSLRNVTSVTIAISGKKATTTINASSGTVTPSTSSAALKSSGWPTITYTLDPGTGAWSTTATATTNTKNPKKDMNEVFSISK